MITIGITFYICVGLFFFRRLRIKEKYDPAFRSPGFWWTLLAFFIVVFFWPIPLFYNLIINP